MNIQITNPLKNNNGYQLVRINYKWGLVDNKNNILLDCVYDLISQIDNDTLDLFFEGHWFVVDIAALPLNFSLVRPCKDCDLMIARKGLKYGVSNRYGNIIIPFNYNRIVEYNGYFWASEEYKENEATRYEVFNYDGERISITPLGVIPSYGNGSQKSIRNGLHFVDIEVIKYYTDYDAVKYFAAFGVSKLKMETKLITVKDTGEIVPLVHISGVQDCTDVILNYEIWPHYHATKDDLKLLPKTVNNLYFRIYYAKNLGNVVQTEPKWLVLNPGDTCECRLNGGKRESDDNNFNPVSTARKPTNDFRKCRKHNILDKSFHKLLPVDFDYEDVERLSFFDLGSENLNVSAKATFMTFGKFGENTPYTEYAKLREEYKNWCVLKIHCGIRNSLLSGNILFNLGTAGMRDVVYSEIVNISPLMLCLRSDNPLTSTQFASLTGDQRKSYLSECSIIDIYIGSTLMWSVKYYGYSDLTYIGRDYFIAKLDSTGNYGILSSKGIAVPFMNSKGYVNHHLLDLTTNVIEELSIINSQNQEVVSIQKDAKESGKYKKIGEPVYGYTPVCNADDKWGLLDENGEELYPFMYNSIVDIYPGGFAQVKLGEKQGLVDKKGQPLFQFGIEKYYYYDGAITPKDRTKTFCVKFNGKTGLMGPEFRMVVPFLYESYINPIDQNYYTYEIRKQKGVLTSEPYRIIIPPIYESISIYENKYGDYLGETLFSCISYNENGGRTEDIINPSGEVLFSVSDGEVRYIFGDTFVEFKESINAVTDEKIYNIYSASQGKIIASYVNCFASNGAYLQVQRDGKWGIFDMKNGIEVIECKYALVGNDWIARESFIPKEGLIALNLNDKCGYIDINENWIISPKFDKGRCFSEGLAPVSINGKWGYIDKTGKVVIRCMYYDAHEFSYGLAAVKGKKGWGYINPQGKIVIPFVYKGAGSFSEMTASVSTESGEGEITASGARLWWYEHEKVRYGSDSWNDAMDEVRNNEDGEWDNYWIDRC